MLEFTILRLWSPKAYMMHYSVKKGIMLWENLFLDVFVPSSLKLLSVVQPQKQEMNREACRYWHEGEWQAVVKAKRADLKGGRRSISFWKGLNSREWVVTFLWNCNWLSQTQAPYSTGNADISCWGLHTELFVWLTCHILLLYRPSRTVHSISQAQAFFFLVCVCVFSTFISF